MNGMNKMMTLALDPKCIAACLEDIEQRIKDGRPVLLPGAETVLVTLRADLAVIERFATKHALSAKLAEGCDAYRRLIGHIEDLPKGPQGGTVGAPCDALNTEAQKAKEIKEIKGFRLNLCPTGVEKCWDSIEGMIKAGHKVVSMGHEKVLAALREDLEAITKREASGSTINDLAALREKYQALLDRGERILKKVHTINGEARSDALKVQAERN